MGQPGLNRPVPVHKVGAQGRSSSSGRTGSEMENRPKLVSSPSVAVTAEWPFTGSKERTLSAARSFMSKTGLKRRTSGCRQWPGVRPSRSRDHRQTPSKVQRRRDSIYIDPLPYLNADRVVPGNVAAQNPRQSSWESLVWKPRRVRSGLQPGATGSGGRPQCRVEACNGNFC